MSRIVIVGAMCAVVALSGAALAAEVQGEAQKGQESTQTNDWSWRLTPYVWFTGLDGKAGVFSGLPAARVEADFGDIFDITDIGLMLNTERRFSEQWAFTGDWCYLKMSTTGDIPAAAGGGEIDFDSTTIIAQPMAAYRVASGDDYAADALGGLRIWTLDNEIEVDGGAMAGAQKDDRETWADPVLGFRARKSLTERFFVNFQGDLGGFGVGSDFTWLAQGGVGYRFSDKIAGHLAYRHLDVDYDKDDIVWDVKMEGLLVGVSFLF